MAKIAQFRIDPARGSVILRLQAERALPIQGVLSCRDVGHVEASKTDDASVVEWQLPAATALCVGYGIILPLKKVWFAPAYNRLLLQDGEMLHGDAENPRRFKTEQHAEGEWIGPPEAFRLVLKDG